MLAHPGRIAAAGTVVHPRTRRAVRVPRQRARVLRHVHACTRLCRAPAHACSRGCVWPGCDARALHAHGLAACLSVRIHPPKARGLVPVSTPARALFPAPISATWARQTRARVLPGGGAKNYGSVAMATVSATHNLCRWLPRFSRRTFRS